MRRVVALVCVLCALPAVASADVVPSGYRAPPAREDSHVDVLRRALAEWMAAPERQRLEERRHPSCTPAVPPRYPRSAAYGSSRGCPSADDVRRVGVDRAVRFWAAEIHAARRRPEQAAALRALPPLTGPEARAAAAAQLEAWRSDEALRPAYALAVSPSVSLEQLATELGRLIVAAVRAGAPRARMVDAALTLLEQLARPFVAQPLAVAVAPLGELDASGRRFVWTLARAASSCARAEVHAQLGPVSVELAVLAAPGQPPRVIVTSTPPALAACFEAATRQLSVPASSSMRATSGTARVTYGPTGPLWDAPAAASAAAR